MVNANNSEQEGKYDILQNAAGEILIIIKYHQGGPENPRFVYDGGSSALLYRSRESAIMLDNINEKARMPLASCLLLRLKMMMLPASIKFRSDIFKIWISLFKMKVKPLVLGAFSIYQNLPSLQ